MDKTKASSLVYEVDYNNCSKRYTSETDRQLKERVKEHKDNGEKSRKDKKTTCLSQHMKTTDYSPTSDDVRNIYRENNWKNRKFKEATTITSHNQEKLMNKIDKRKKNSNLCNIVLNDKT